MPKSKIKDSTPITIRMENEILEKLEEFCDISGQSKTVAIERAVSEYIISHKGLLNEFSSEKGE